MIVVFTLQWLRAWDTGKRFEEAGQRAARALERQPGEDCFSARVKPWGLHEFTVADPDGNLFRVFYDFATPEREKNQ